MRDLPSYGLVFDGQGRPTDNIGKFFPLFYRYTHEVDNLVDMLSEERECEMHICPECAEKEVYEYGRDPFFLKPFVNHDDWSLECGHCAKPITDSNSLVQEELHRTARYDRDRRKAIRLKWALRNHEFIQGGAATE